MKTFGQKIKQCQEEMTHKKMVSKAARVGVVSKKSICGQNN